MSERAFDIVRRLKYRDRAARVLGTEADKLERGPLPAPDEFGQLPELNPGDISDFEDRRLAAALGIAAHEWADLNEYQRIDRMEAYLTAPTQQDREAKSKPCKDSPKRTSVNECMASMLLEDPTRVGWSATKWAEAVSSRLRRKKKISATAVKLTSTWTKQIIPGRALMKADRINRKR